ncbi:MAG TPA: YqgE/AlgH family protein [Rhizomicrobium sp.]|nr:YqgE/AlgH family protein [Rhizomicrobium sp.]
MATRQPPIGGHNFLQGNILIALPGMTDPRFEKSVIFMCAHSAEGAMGIMVNKAIEGLHLHQLLGQLDIRPTPGAPDPQVLFGGPVETGQGFVLHSSDYGQGESTLSISSEISLTTTLDVLRAMAEGSGPKRALFALGYAGWGPGQIEGEIQANSWVHCGPDNDIVFGDGMDSKWAVALRKLGIDMSGLSANTGRA